jgi:hypothetical protein
MERTMQEQMTISKEDAKTLLALAATNLKLTPDGVRAVCESALLLYIGKKEVFFNFVHNSETGVTKLIFKDVSLLKDGFWYED